MSQSMDSSTLRNLRNEHLELITALSVKEGVVISMSPLPSTNKATNIAWLKKVIKGLKAQISTKRTPKKAPKPSHSTRKGKFTKKQARQYVKSFEQNYDEQSIKNIDSLRKSKYKSSKKKVKKFDEKKKLYTFLINEFDL